jgi:hypothetical protein
MKKSGIGENGVAAAHFHAPRAAKRAPYPARESSIVSIMAWQHQQ